MDKDMNQDWIGYSEEIAAKAAVINQPWIGLREAFAAGWSVEEIVAGKKED